MSDQFQFKMKTFITKTLLIPFLLLFVMASCSKEELVRPQAEPGAEFVEKGGEEEDMFVVRGDVVNSSQANVTGATCKLKQSGQTMYFGTSDANGHVNFGNVLTGTYDYEISASGYQLYTVSITVNAQVSRTDELIDL